MLGSLHARRTSARDWHRSWSFSSPPLFPQELTDGLDDVALADEEQLRGARRRRPMPSSISATLPTPAELIASLFGRDSSPRGHHYTSMQLSRMLTLPYEFPRISARSLDWIELYHARNTNSSTGSVKKLTEFTSVITALVTNTTNSEENRQLLGTICCRIIPQNWALFRDLIKRRCGSHSKRKQRAEKIRKAEARVIATRALAEKPNAFLLGQVMAISSLSPNRINSGSVQLDLDLEHEDDTQLAQPGPSSA